MKWSAQAPANIALIKYMGKIDPIDNIPANSSLSYTLDHLLSFVELEQYQGDTDIWQPLAIPGENLLQLSSQSQQRFLNHLQQLKKLYDYSGNFIVRSGNNFSSDCGLASSAASFAALTRCAVHALSDLTNTPIASIQEQAQLSQKASGSSCRSFFSPWALWHNTSIEQVTIPYTNLIHSVIMIDNSKKKITSSEAHSRVPSSSLFKERPARANQRLQTLLQQFKDLQWDGAFNTIWQEFWDMHTLFETANPPFGYMTADSLRALHVLRDCWDQQGDGPLVTMDAGPNIHLLFRPDQEELQNTLLAKVSGNDIFYSPRGGAAAGPRKIPPNPPFSKGGTNMDPL